MTTENTTTSFVHLHLNTNYSLYHGLVESREAARICKETGMTACACTDHGNLGVAMKFKSAMESQGIKPIYGCEFLITGMSDWSHWLLPHLHRGTNVVCLAENLEGYRNLCRLTSEIYHNTDAHSLSGHKVSYVTKELLRKHHNGLIALSGGPFGEISIKCREKEMNVTSWFPFPKFLWKQMKSKEMTRSIDDAIGEYLDIFGKGNFFLEMQDHGRMEEKFIIQELLAASRRNDVPVVATNDVHYLTRKQARAHEILLCMGVDEALNDHVHEALPGTPEYYLKSPEEMRQLFDWCPEALQNTVAIAERCNVLIPAKETDCGMNYKPPFRLPENFKGTRDDFLRLICKTGLKRRYGFDVAATAHTEEQKKTLARMEQELAAIAKHGLSNELLVIWDLLWDSEQNDWRCINVGRGAICGSLVAYLMPLTDVDPLKHNLLFERYVNEERLTWVQVDIDQMASDNERVVQRARELYGTDHVAERIELKTMPPKTIVQRVSTALGYGHKFNMIADIVEKFWTTRDALWSSEELQRLVKTHSSAREIVEASIELENRVLYESNEHGGILLSSRILSDICPVYRLWHKEHLGTCIDFFAAQQLGILEIGWFKTDLFVTKALHHYSKCCELKPQMLDIPDNIPEIYDMLAMDDDVFYCGAFSNDSPDVEVSASFRNQYAEEFGELGHILRKVKPRSIEELAICYTLSRPGLDKFLDEYLLRRSGKVPVTYETPELEPILKETYGLILYQEQFMQVVHVISGLSLGKADRMRRSMAKRNVQQTEMWHNIFFEEARKRGFNDDCIEKIWEELNRHAMYCFMKAHAVARALLLYRVAYIKANLSL